MENLFIADRGNTVVRKVNSASIIATFVGNGASGYSGALGGRISLLEQVGFNDSTFRLRQIKNHGKRNRKYRALKFVVLSMICSPTNGRSVLRLVSAVPEGTNVAVTWQSVAGINYFLERSTNLAASPCFGCVATNIVGQSGTTTYTDTNATGAGPFFYRVGVGN